MASGERRVIGGSPSESNTLSITCFKVVLRRAAAQLLAWVLQSIGYWDAFGRAAARPQTQVELS